MASCIKEYLLSTFSTTFGTIFGTKKKITKKHTQVGGVGNQHLPLALNSFLKHNSPIFGTKLPKCRRFLQHYYRGTFIESHRKPTDLPEISYRGPETCREFYTRFSKIKFLTNFLNISLRICRKMITFVPEFNLRREFSKISVE